MEERERAHLADRVYLAAIHRELSKQLDRRADECDRPAEQFDRLVERASEIIWERDR